jgi:hypothetical protein
MFLAQFTTSIHWEMLMGKKVWKAGLFLHYFLVFKLKLIAEWKAGNPLLSHHTDEERLMESASAVAVLPHNQSR